MRGAIFLALLIAVSACQATPPTAREQANICDIFDDRKDWYRAAAQSERRWGAPIALQMAIMKAESSFDPDARPARGNRRFLGLLPGRRPSTAYGFAQALNGTWDEYRETTGNNGAERDDIDDATDFIGWYVARSSRIANIRTSDAKAQYLAYHEGAGGYTRGTWRSKPGLIRLADRVAADAYRYDQQLPSCEKRLKRNWIPFF